MDSDIDLLKRQISFAHERIDRLSKENFEFRLLIRALMFSHHDKEELATQIEADKELALSIGLGADISDDYIQHLQEKANQAIALVLSRVRDQP